MHITPLASCLTLLVASASGHMQMINPPPLRSKFNPHTGSQIDYSMTNPLSKDGSDFPCKGYHLQLSTSLGTPVIKIRGGKSYVMTFAGEAFHQGGSCQVSLSVDEGETFHVLHSYIGDCPATSGNNTLDFWVPADIPTVSKALFAWTWFNKLGNREMYMNCASVSTVSGKDGEGGFLDRPKMFAANIANGCTTQESKDLKFPEPGPEVTIKNRGAVPPVGDCKPRERNEKPMKKPGGSWLGPWVPTNRTGERNKTEGHPVPGGCIVG